MRPRIPTNGERIGPILDAYLGNPFALEPNELSKAAAALRGVDPGEVLAALVAAGDVARAKQLVLAVGHEQAQRYPNAPERVLVAETLPPPVERLLPRRREDYLRIVMAAGRAHRALTAIHGTSEAMRAVRRETWAACFGHSLRHALDLERVIRDHDILILGETGTGKELLAEAIRLATPGPKSGAPAPSASLNAAAIPETLVESELFGHVRGAFTGASEDRVGRIRSAHRGCLFLDEVGDLPTTTQVKLLRVIETNNVYPLGSDDPYRVDVRYVAATHKPLATMVDDGDFRRDLFERLAGNVVRIPPLRERPEDIAVIGRRFADRYVGSRSATNDGGALAQWLESNQARRYAWPGNVRELQNALRSLLLGMDPGLKRGTDTRDPRPDVDRAVPANIATGQASLRRVNDWYIARVLDSVGGNHAEAARRLGVDRSTVRRRLQRAGLESA